jgi:tetratricopeptide (TPR) repeat protein
MQRLMVAVTVLLLLALPVAPSAATPAPADPEVLADAPAPAADALDGTPLYPAALTEEADRRLHADLAIAQAAFDSDPSEMNTIWLGRRLAYLQRYREAVDLFSAGLERFPQSYRLYRHRGHRHITLRDFDAAIADFARAYALMPKDVTETEPDGMPNALGIPLSNTQFNVLYHHALAHYLKGEWLAAERLWRECLDYADNPDLQVATRDWLYMTLRRLGEPAAAAEVIAAIPRNIEVIEDQAYLRRLRLYRGELSPEALLADGIDDSQLLVTQGYGVANWYLYEGQPERAAEIRRRILGTGAWAAFGYIAAEADSHRLK